MKTIIIYRKSSQSFLNRYQVLFQPFLDSKQVAFCFWDENATDFASALSDLPELIRGEETWRAIVALPVTDDPEDDWSRECRQDNPFDFLCNTSPEPEHMESSVPLIVLAQMLGGIPLATPDYRTVMVDDSRDPSYKQLVIQREDSEDMFARQQAEWEDLKDRYSTLCVLPSSLYLFAGRVVSDIQIPQDTDYEILQRHETDSSMFWYRNTYPAAARFMTQTFSRPGNAYYKEDLFTFWMTALTLAINEYPTGTFEAYKLYDVRAIVSRDILHRHLNNYYNRLNTIQYIADLQIQEYRKDIQHVRENEELPNYQTRIPIVYSNLSDSDLLISSRGLGLANDCPVEELPWWYGAVRHSRNVLKRLLRSIKPVLDRACTTCRYFARVNDNEMIELDEYQVEEMETELSELEAEVLSFTRGRALPVRAFQHNIEQRTGETATRMKKRMSRKIAVTAGSISLIAYFSGFLPDIVHQIMSGGQPWVITGTALAGTFMLGLCAMGFLFYGRSSVRRKVSNYNGTMKSILAAISDSAEHFSEYLSKCCSYMRGRSILQFQEQKARNALFGIRQMIEHTTHLKTYMELVECWLQDFNLALIKSEGYAHNVYFDFDIPPEKNKEYLLYRGDLRDVSLGDDEEGAVPYVFVTGLQVQRIPVFEERDEQ